MSRAHVRDSSKHVILGTQQYKPNEFATQINLNMDNAWGILRCIVDICMKQKDGKYLIMKDPNKVCFVSYLILHDKNNESMGMRCSLLLFSLPSRLTLRHIAIFSILETFPNEG